MLISLSEQRQNLRQHLRQARKNLSSQQQCAAALQIVVPALEIISTYQAECIAFYLPFDGEVSPLALLSEIQKSAKQCVVPVLHPFSHNQLLFLNYNESELVKNRFGIYEPRLNICNVLPPQYLDMIFVPLVGCDKQKNRLGMGGGFYDRTLSQLTHTISVGLAHQCQVIDKVPCEIWDQKLDHLIIV